MRIGGIKMFSSNSITTTIKASTYFGLPMFTQSTSTDADDVVIDGCCDELECLIPAYRCGGCSIL